MQIVIEIPDEYFNAVKEIPVEQCTTDMLIIRNGKPLPKGHGDLIDRKALLENWYDDYCKFMTIEELNSMNGIIRNAETILPADKEDT